MCKINCTIGSSLCNVQVQFLNRSFPGGNPVEIQHALSYCAVYFSGTIPLAKGRYMDSTCTINVQYGGEKYLSTSILRQERPITRQRVGPGGRYRTQVRVIGDMYSIFLAPLSDICSTMRFEHMRGVRSPVRVGLSLTDPPDYRVHVHSRGNQPLWYQRDI